MVGFDSDVAHKLLRYMLDNPRFTQRQMARDLDIDHGRRISDFVRWLEDFRYVIKTLDPKTGLPLYEIPSRAALLNFYSRFRNIQTEKAGPTYEIGSEPKSAMKYLNDNGAIMCLTSALGFYDDYGRDPELHAYVANASLIDEIKTLEKGKVRVNLYWYKYPDDSKIEKGIRVTSQTRTIMDLYCNNMAYLAERLMPRIWHP